jgi:hypothetical protein
MPTSDPKHNAGIHNLVGGMFRRSGDEFMPHGAHMTGFFYDLAANEYRSACSADRRWYLPWANLADVLSMRGKLVTEGAAKEPAGGVAQVQFDAVKLYDRALKLLKRSEDQEKSQIARCQEERCRILIGQATAMLLTRCPDMVLDGEKQLRTTAGMSLTLRSAWDHLLLYNLSCAFATAAELGDDHWHNEYAIASRACLTCCFIRAECESKLGMDLLDWYMAQADADVDLVSIRGRDADWSKHKLFLRQELVQRPALEGSDSKYFRRTCGEIIGKSEWTGDPLVLDSID